MGIKTRLRQILFLFVWLFFPFASLSSQDNSYIPPGGSVGFFQDTVTVFGRMTVNGGTLFFNSNTHVIFYGDTMRLAPGSSVSGSGQFIFKGPRLIPSFSSFTQYLDGGGVKLGSILIDNSQNLHLSSTNGGVLDTLRFVNGKLFLNSHDFTVGNNNPGVIDGYTENRFVVTNSLLAGTGNLVRENVGSALQVFPIGPHGLAYEPAALSNSGTPDNFAIRVAPEVYEFVTGGTQQNDRSTQTTWFVAEGTLGGSLANLYLQHNTWHEGQHFTNYRPFHFISRYVGFSPNTEGDTISLTNWDNFQKASTQAGVSPGYLTTGTPVSSTIVSQRLGLTYFGAFAKTVWNDPFMITPLPIDFLGINAVWKTETVGTVNWMVDKDEDVQSYKVEHALPGATKFSTLTTVAAKSLPGTVRYSADDDLGEITGTVLYRVTATSKNGATMQSSIAKLYKYSKDAGLMMAPNPATNYVDIRTVGTKITDDALEVSVYNTAGSHIFSASDPAGEKLRINTSTWSEGVYIVQIRRGPVTRIEKLVVTKG